MMQQYCVHVKRTLPIPGSGAVILVALVLMAGCSDPGVELTTVEGTITLDGLPISNASITLMPSSGRPSGGRTDENGRYRLQYTSDAAGALIGTHKVVIRTEQDAVPEMDIAAFPELIPARYNSESELEVQIVKGQFEYNFDLTSD